MPHYDERFDAYIEKAADFAKPILTHIRKLVHEADPEIEETIKWGHLFFVRNKPVCMMAAFKKHCNFGFWGADQLPDPEKLLKKENDQHSLLNQLFTVADLPPDDILLWYIKNAVDHSLSQAKIKGVPKPKAPAKEAAMPEDFAAALEDNEQAAIVFKQFSPSKKRDYIEWLTEAKTAATRNKRMATAVEWISEGKSRQWKYEKC